jgi:hypothetical protein
MPEQQGCWRMREKGPTKRQPPPQARHRAAWPRTCQISERVGRAPLPAVAAAHSRRWTLGSRIGTRLAEQDAELVLKQQAVVVSVTAMSHARAG